MPVRLSVGFAVLCSLAVTAGASAHHAPSNYTNTYTDIEGVVKEVHLVVPHSWVYLEVKETSGESRIWLLEANGRASLERVGITPTYLKAGDVIKARCYPLRDGSAGCRLGFIKASDGSIKNWNAETTAAPSDFR